jgi:hypothetical protein
LVDINAGNLRKTPVGTLGLQPGELVEVLSLDEMRQTLDRKGRNRGLICDIELEVSCGKRYWVLSRLDRFISDYTGEMKKVEATVILDGVHCLCARVVGGCSRLDYGYYREVSAKTGCVSFSNPAGDNLKGGRYASEDSCPSNPQYLER